MQTNHMPAYDMTDNPTGCCPRFRPDEWDGQTLHFENKLFVRARTRSILHVPVNMGSVFKKTLSSIDAADATPDEFAVLSHDDSPWRAEHLFAVGHDVPGADMVALSGDFVTHVFEGPFSRMGSWTDQMHAIVADQGRRLQTLYFFYTTCPKCAKAYGKNYVVGIAQVS